MHADTGETRSFLERLLFPYVTYTVPYGTLFPKKMKTGFIYTMNVPEERSKEFGYEQIFKTNERYVEMLLGSAETLCAFDTCQVDDYSKMVIESFDPIHNGEVHRHQHTHEAVELSHMHNHDEHHQHEHADRFTNEPHEHRRVHEPMTHSHVHWPDIHHRHTP